MIYYIILYYIILYCIILYYIILYYIILYYILDGIKGACCPDNELRLCLQADIANEPAPRSSGIWGRLGHYSIGTSENLHSAEITLTMCRRWI